MNIPPEGILTKQGLLNAAKACVMYNSCANCPLKNLDNCQLLMAQAVLDCIKADDNNEILKAQDELDKCANVDHPEHYQGSHECIDLMREIYGDEAVRHFCICNAYKYRFRAGKKRGESAEQDLAKAEWYERYVMDVVPQNPMLILERQQQARIKMLDDSDKE